MAHDVVDGVKLHSTISPIDLSDVPAGGRRACVRTADDPFIPTPSVSA
jgi:hypothetical protein